MRGGVHAVWRRHAAARAQRLTPRPTLRPRPAGRALALSLAQLSRAKLREMPEATGDIREIIGQVRQLPGEALLAAHALLAFLHGALY
jgi:hypothetical protein